MLSPMGPKLSLTFDTKAYIPTASRPNLVLLDLHLPRKDGRVVLADVKSDPSLRRIPIVIFSTSRAAKDIERSYELGANSYVSKPPPWPNGFLP